MSHSLELAVGAISIAMFVGTLAAIPWLVSRLPTDYFVQPPPKHPLPTRIARNAFGTLLVIMGIAMLVLPGQGILTILVGVSIVDLPIRHRLVRWLLLRPKVESVMQRLREKAGKPPLLFPDG